VSPLPSELLDRVSSWRDQDPDTSDQSTLDGLITRAQSGDDGAISTLTEWFSGSLRFGTAGLRGPMRPGPTGMNRVVVAHASWALGQFLLRQHSGQTTPTVVVGFDARKHSDQFAADVAKVMASLGVKPLLFDRPTPTPVLAFAVRHLAADAGVMITASHNPPADNGYKVFAGGVDGGSQIIPPTDADIESLIRQSYATNSARALLSAAGDVTHLGSEVIDSYQRATLELTNSFSADARGELIVSYTPLHGVGADVFLPLVKASGFSGVSPVTIQLTPDGAFPTVSFPNPEEAGTLDLAHEHAEQINADLVIAHDPDADRLAVSLPRTTPDGVSWGMLSGNELAALLLDQVGRLAQQAGQHGCLARSLVTTPIIDRIAAGYGLQVSVTPTGFKWISRAPNILAGCEEALGYLVNPDTVRDKDGISAGLLALLIAAEEKANGRTLADRLDDIRDRFGGFASGQVTLRARSVTDIATAMDTIRNDTDTFVPREFAHRITDYSGGIDGFPPSNIILCEEQKGSRVIFRPSGTEPKLKVYVDVLSDTQQQATTDTDTLKAALVSLLTPLTARLPGVEMTTS